MHFHGGVGAEGVFGKVFSELVRARSARRGFYLGDATVLGIRARASRLFVEWDARGARGLVIRRGLEWRARCAA